MRASRGLASPLLSGGISGIPRAVWSGNLRHCGMSRGHGRAPRGSSSGSRYTSSLHYINLCLSEIRSSLLTCCGNACLSPSLPLSRARASFALCCPRRRQQEQAGFTLVILASLLVPVITASVTTRCNTTGPLASLQPYQSDR